MKYFVETRDEYGVFYNAFDTLQDAKEHASRFENWDPSAKIIEGHYIDEASADSNTTANVLDSTITAESGSTMTIRDSIDYIVSIILAGLNSTNGCWYKNSERVEWQLRDAIDDKELIDSIMKQFNAHINIIDK